MAAQHPVLRSALHGVSIHNGDSESIDRSPHFFDDTSGTCKPLMLWMARYSLLSSPLATTFSRSSRFPWFSRFSRSLIYQPEGGGREGALIDELINLFVNLSCRLRDKLALMQHVGVCFKLVGHQDEDAMYWFPILGCYFPGLLLFFFLFFRFLFLFNSSCL